MRGTFTATTLLLASCIITASPVLAETPFEAAGRLIAAGHIPEARRALAAELRMHPKHVEARYNLALLLQQIDKQQEAAELYKANLAIDWHLPSVINLAALLQKQGHTDQAKQWLQKSTEQLRYEAAPWYLLAAMAEAEGRTADARQHFHKAVTTDPLNGFAHLRLGAFQSRHKLADKGLKEANRAMQLLPDCAPCWRESGDILLAASLHRKALEAYQSALAIKPDIATRQQMIHLLERLGEHQRATRMQQALDSWKKHDPSASGTD